VMNLYLWQFTKVPFTWYVALGSIVTFAIGYGASFFLRRTMPVAETATDGNQEDSCSLVG